MIKSNDNISYWLLTTEYPPQHGGGISTYCEATARMLISRGCRVLIVTPGDVHDFTISQQEGIEVVRFNVQDNGTEAYLGHCGRVSYGFLEVIKKLISLRGKPDIIEAQDYEGIAYYLLQARHLKDPVVQGIPIVITLHSPAFLYWEYNKVPTYRFPEFWTCEMEKHSIIAADHLISPSAFLKTTIEDILKVPLTPTTVIPNPYTLPPVPDRKTSIQKGKIVYYGKLSVQKGSLVLLEYFKELWDEGSENQLHVVGGTDIVYHIEKQTIGDIVRRKYSEYIKRGLLQLHGKVEPKQAWQHVEDAHVIVFPSIVDNLPYAVIEMMSLGKVVLASVQGGQREIITDGEDGFLFDHSIVGHFKKRLNEVLSFDEQRLKSIGAKARATVESKFSFDRIFKEKYAVIRCLQNKVVHAKTEFPFLYQEQREEIHLSGEEHLLSVVIPFYNMGTMVREAIESVKANGLNKEIIVVNDGSTDPESLGILVALREEGIKVIDKKNEGLARARNDGARIAKGRYLAFLDADDKVSPNYYRRAIEVLRAYDNVYFVGAWVQYFEDSRKLWPSFTPQPPYLLVHNPVNSSSLVYKTAAFLQAGLNDPRLEYGLEDYDSVISMMSRGYNGVALPEVQFFYRVRKNSMFRKLNTTKLINAYQYITGKHQSYFSKYSTGVINLLNANGPGYYFDNPTEEMEVVSKVKQNGRLTGMAVSFIKSRPWLKSIVLRTLAWVKK